MFPQQQQKKSLSFFIFLSFLQPSFCQTRPVRTCASSTAAFACQGQPCMSGSISHPSRSSSTRTTRTSTSGRKSMPSRKPKTTGTPMMQRSATTTHAQNSSAYTMHYTKSQCPEPCLQRIDGVIVMYNVNVSQKLIIIIIIIMKLLFQHVAFF